MTTRVTFRGDAAKRVMKAIRPQVQAVAERVADDAARHTPQESGRLAISWTTEPLRRGVRVGSEQWYAKFPEFGTRSQPEVAMLRRAVADLGLDAR